MANRLIDELSPYLLQHAHNPVDWYAWGDEAFERAEKENKPVLVSIGYAACHWCHVMEKESFEDAATAAYMNEHFVCIKVDREEYPDVDHMYMDAVQAISGSGGWPLNVFVTPGRVPFFGGTYFPVRPAFNRQSWAQVLQQMHHAWHNRQEDVAGQAEQMTAYLRQASATPAKGEGATWDMDTCKLMAENLLKQADKGKGGFGRAPKFPGTMAINFLLEHYHFTQNEAALKQALLSLDSMIYGGIYDQLGGGFARYATDEDWLIPHFEKMLYDNALIVLSLCDAWMITKQPHYKIAIQETIAFTERELKDISGGYYSALDADSEGVEGKFYTWTWAEWLDTIGENDEAVAAYFGVKEDGNWEETNILHVPMKMAAVAEEHHIPIEALTQRIDQVKAKLLARRSGRIRPATDDKSLLSWNALMNLAVCKAGVALQEPAYIKRATEHMQWMLQNFSTKDGLMHVWKAGIARIAANLDDYAYLVQAMLQLASATGDEALILKAAHLIETAKKDFEHEDGDFFYYSSASHQGVPVRKVDVYDGATPSANAVMVYNFFVSGLVMERTEWVEQAKRMMYKMNVTVSRYPYSFGLWGVLLQRYVAGIKAVTITGKGFEEMRIKLEGEFLSQCYIVNSTKEISELPILENKKNDRELYIFVCTEFSCNAPVNDFESVKRLVRY
ncbi:MAG: thioredoxin domain-containing protein [Flavipsychrobacter sp.]|nr:thioredoxin domain-containing protein [Flavipsychrobacter sp.]